MTEVTAAESPSFCFKTSASNENGQLQEKAKATLLRMKKFRQIEEKCRHIRSNKEAFKASLQTYMWKLKVGEEILKHLRVEKNILDRIRCPDECCGHGGRTHLQNIKPALLIEIHGRGEKSCPCHFSGLDKPYSSINEIPGEGLTLWDANLDGAECQFVDHEEPSTVTAPSTRADEQVQLASLAEESGLSSSDDSPPAVTAPPSKRRKTIIGGRAGSSEQSDDDDSMSNVSRKTNSSRSLLAPSILISTEDITSNFSFTNSEQMQGGSQLSLLARGLEDEFAEDGEIHPEEEHHEEDEHAGEDEEEVNDVEEVASAVTAASLPDVNSLLETYLVSSQQTVDLVTAGEGARAVHQGGKPEDAAVGHLEEVLPPVGDAGQAMNQEGARVPLAVGDAVEAMHQEVAVVTMAVRDTEHQAGNTKKAAKKQIKKKTYKSQLGIVETEDGMYKCPNL